MDEIYVEVLLALLGLIVVIGTLICAFQAKSKADRNAKRINKLERITAEQEQKLVRMQETLESIARSREKVAAQPVVAPAMPRPVVEPEPVPVPEETLQGRLLQFIQEYNDLMSRRDNSMATRDAKKAFIQKYRLRGFDCTNYEERMNHPELAPQFAEKDNPAQASFWALQVQGETYRVVPNLKAYEEQVHQTAGMKEVFDSNFQGGSYSGIRVLEPAFFAGLTQLVKKGKLDLKK